VLAREGYRLVALGVEYALGVVMDMQNNGYVLGLLPPVACTSCMCVVSYHSAKSKGDSAFVLRTLESTNTIPGGGATLSSRDVWAIVICERTAQHRLRWISVYASVGML